MQETLKNLHLLLACKGLTIGGVSADVNNPELRTPTLANQMLSAINANPFKISDDIQMIGLHDAPIAIEKVQGLGESHYGISCPRIHERLVPSRNSHCLDSSPSNYRRQSSFSGSLIHF